MQAAVCVLAMVLGADGDLTQARVVVPEPAPAAVSAAAVEVCPECGQASVECGHGHHRATATGKGWLGDWFGPMPQTCYQPRYGCYPGNPRTIHRYPAFHGTYYRAPYNYRQYMDYPWFAAPHEPLGYSSGPAGATEVIMEIEPAEPMPAPQPLSENTWRAVQ